MHIIQQDDNSNNCSRGNHTIGNSVGRTKQRPHHAIAILLSGKYLVYQCAFALSPRQSAHLWVPNSHRRKKERESLIFRELARIRH